jgi:hypothetical protein
MEKREKSEKLDFYVAMGEELDSKAIPYELCSKEEQRHRDSDDKLFWIKQFSEDSKEILADTNEMLHQKLAEIRDYLHKIEVFIDYQTTKQSPRNYNVALWLIVIVLILILIKI